VVHVARHRSAASTWWIRPRSLAVLGVAVAGLATAVWLPARNDVASATTENSSSFTDDFDADRGDRLDRNRWLIAGNRDNARQDGRGKVTLSRLAAVRRAFIQPAGHAEARIKVEREPGPWRAFGVLGTDGKPLRGDLRTLDPEADPTSGDDFHTYEIDWTPESILWTVDGEPSIRMDREKPEAALAVVLNLATDSRRSPRMVVDFVRVTTEPTEPSSPPATTAPTVAPTKAPTKAPTVAPTKAPTKAPTAAPTTAAPTTPPAPKAKAWAPFTDYAAGDLVTYKGVTYRVKEAHTALPGWEPTALPNLFVKL
jgi:Glycosyl hydrolases family 16